MCPHFSHTLIEAGAWTFLAALAEMATSSRKYLNSLSMRYFRKKKTFVVQFILGFDKTETLGRFNISATYFYSEGIWALTKYALLRQVFSVVSRPTHYTVIELQKH